MSSLILQSHFLPSFPYFLLTDIQRYMCKCIVVCTFFLFFYVLQEKCSVTHSFWFWQRCFRGCFFISKHHTAPFIFLARSPQFHITFTRHWRRICFIFRRFWFGHRHFKIKATGKAKSILINITCITQSHLLLLYAT